ncbi:MAG: hypothetical protein A2268_09230 [Candidatus Raymondbacteria bacterium RifOxyA12_full_50_37]|uniref:Uncharacterized protein n=1 Tax=Candidatus Raymondbacteria bacterium RIFOXYD12_FULL_49_13 TaxID=1817890 RepID=A0A1F7FH58_UNCRA|nr:MAG: hypothetical protein A2268_09230 [Candidatus Raymondbacteria bacterium RifOxyA12_full_50_37]OGJ88933.1 MAG: hypothetical protein A2248_11720 [Candidatus Raymondbacteria bacterium RIFOXYA2_FULL_49_16]OGJ99135.1 MAG: hypothetical protein A2487_03495 [Candidatus Raymondbacteria bacterium RifOxyC12_full_50_8]OGK05931.1 MAG: hypothetical protein A2519_04850 [Candidatus Raymondbacteria bacterium RIFOXYD12_FULL_49_13]OGP42095.1 MAG: hypothetical protein A2324_14825 [Candidatus Raymondbacteria 
MAFIVTALTCHTLSAVTSENYIRLLEKWNPTARKWTHEVQGNDGLVYFGTGGHENWAMQAHCTAFAGIAVLATAPELDENYAGETREQLRQRALKMLRYILHTHKSGDITCTTGQSWGYSWISGLALERMSHAFTALKPWLTDDDRQRMRDLLVAECDFLLKDYPVVGAIDAATDKNKPESNIWNGAMLYRTAVLYPDAPHAAKYREKASSLLLNGISIPSDATSEILYSGCQLKQWHIGPNYTENYGLNHHGYLNIGYMEICLSNIAMLHFFCLDNGIPVPEELYHHCDKLWELTKSLTFDDGRLWRIGGDTRMRYCYCQDYALPVWLMITDRFGDPDAAKFEDGWFNVIAREQNGNPDGAFLSDRLAKLRDTSPFYYCRLEGDRVVSMSLGAYYRRLLARKKKPTQPTSLSALKAWSDEFHGAAMVRGQRRLASWVWKSAQCPCGTVVPADRSDMVEWQWNLAGLIKGTGCKFEVTPDKKYVLHTFEGGFATCGSYRWNASDNPGEGSSLEEVGLAHTAMVALPDDATTVILQYATATRPVFINQVLGLNYNIPNDVFNRGIRTYRFKGKNRKIIGAGTSDNPAHEILACGKDLQIDGRVNVSVIYGANGVSLFRPGARNAMMAHSTPMKFSGAGASLYCDVISIPAQDTQRYYNTNEVLYDIGAVIGVDFCATAVSRIKPDSLLKVVEVTCADQCRYVVAANFSDSPEQGVIPFSDEFKNLCGKGATAGKDGIQLDLPAGEVIVLKLKTKP